MNSIRINKKGIYRIEVNDEGECIEFDLQDVGLVYRCYEALENIEKKSKEVKEKELEITKNTNDAKELTEKLILLEKEAFKELREIMDGFLGEGSCQKIFGDRNYYTMFDDLIDELTKKRKELGGKSHFDMMKISADGVKDRIKNKYKKNRDKKAI